jgi:hypothetical protein
LVQWECAPPAAYDATLINFSKFCPPVVADGRLLVATYDGRVDIYVPNR